MKIGILSLNPGHNYGGILQSYALKTVLERMGHEVSVISKKRQVSLFQYNLLLRYPVRAFKKYILKKNIGIFKERKKAQFYSRICCKMYDFCDSNLNLTFVYNLRQLKDKDFNAFVVGSDQVWRPRYFKEQFSSDIADAYLKFAKDWDIKKIAYAPSFGVDEWEYNPKETIECAELLQKFDGVSVREEAGVNLCKEYFNADAVCLCDPTMLLKKKDYESIVKKSAPKSKGNLLVYCLDESEELNSLVGRISKEKSLVPFSTNTNESKNPCVKDSVESWIRGFMDAEFVITDSFHACVFSLIFRKPFVVLGNKDRGMSRFESLLTTFNQQQRLLLSATEFDESLMQPTFDGIDNVFYDLQHKAHEFLNKTLK